MHTSQSMTSAGLFWDVLVPNMNVRLKLMVEQTEFPSRQTVVIKEWRLCGRALLWAIFSLPHSFLVLCIYFHIKRSNLCAGAKACILYSLLVQSAKRKGISLTEYNFLVPLPFREYIVLQPSVGANLWIQKLVFAILWGWSKGGRVGLDRKVKTVKKSVKWLCFSAFLPCFTKKHSCFAGIKTAMINNASN